MAKELLKGDALKEATKKVMKNIADARGVDVSEIEEKTIGNNGRPLNDTVSFTGKVDLIDREINGNKTSYYAAQTSNDDWISIKSLMGISSLKGYQLEGKFPHEYIDNGLTVTDTIAADTSEEFKTNPNMARWTPPSRNLYECIAQLQATESLKDVTLTYRGIVVRPYVAKKASITSYQSWNKGANRVMSAQIWTL